MAGSVYHILFWAKLPDIWGVYFKFHLAMQTIRRIFFNRVGGFLMYKSTCKFIYFHKSIFKEAFYNIRELKLDVMKRHEVLWELCHSHKNIYIKVNTKSQKQNCKTYLFYRLNHQLLKITSWNNYKIKFPILNVNKETHIGTIDMRHLILPPEKL